VHQAVLVVFAVMTMFVKVSGPKFHVACPWSSITNRNCSCVRENSAGVEIVIGKCDLPG
jgi:hypothetical protein